MATFIILRHPVNILVTALTKTGKFDKWFDLQALTLVGPPKDNLELDPLAHVR